MKTKNQPKAKITQEKSGVDVFRAFRKALKDTICIEENENDVARALTCLTITFFAELKRLGIESARPSDIQFLADIEEFGRKKKEAEKRAKEAQNNQAERQVSDIGFASACK